MEIGPIERPAEFAPPHLTEKALISALRERLKEVVTDDGYPPIGSGDGKSAHLFSGAVLVAKSGKSVFEEGYGLGGPEHSVPNTITTRFSIGSMNKMFTAVLILQLVEAGKIKLDAPLGEYLHDYPNKDVASKVTIDQLLSHTGGLGISSVLYLISIGLNCIRIRTTSSSLGIDLRDLSQEAVSNTATMGLSCSVE